jgi:hypothetical protein
MKRAVKAFAVTLMVAIAFSSCDTGSSDGDDDLDGTEKTGDAGNTGTTVDPKTTDTPTTTVDPGSSGGPTAWGSSLDVTKPASPVRLIFIHHSCGENWLANGNGELGNALNDNNYYVSDTYYGWNTEKYTPPKDKPEDTLGDHTNTEDWPSWFNDTQMPYVYASSSHTTWDHNDIAAPSGENEIIMFKSCYPCSEVGSSIDDEKEIYTGLLAYFAAHQDKLFVLVTPPSEDAVDSATLTKELCDWLVNRETGWLKGYAHKNVAVYDFYCTLTATDAKHTISGGSETHTWGASYDGRSEYPTSDSHPSAAGNQKATAEFIPLLNASYNYWK